MKWIAKCMIAAAIFCAGNNVSAQITADAGMENPSILAEAKAPATIQAKEITVELKNDCGKHVTIFAGSKKEVFDGHSQSIGGMSNNTLYVKEGDVVCIMNDPKTIQACSILKPGVSKLEINPGGNGFIK
ncbi:MAG: hypothetical protein JWO03_400 [Bacteroidetes bacterium]|nr:hypothetical protein [Bacteroidota bacterium]